MCNNNTIALIHIGWLADVMMRGAEASLKEVLALGGCCFFVSFCCCCCCWFFIIVVVVIGIGILLLLLRLFEVFAVTIHYPMGIPTHIRNLLQNVAKNEAIPGNTLILRVRSIGLERVALSGRRCRNNALASHVGQQPWRVRSSLSCRVHPIQHLDHKP
jgi:hypothetical protein